MKKEISLEYLIAIPKIKDVFQSKEKDIVTPAETAQHQFHL